MLKLIAMAVFSTAIGILSFKFELNVSYVDYKDYCTVLLAVSGMVFTIMGIWIAFVYPNAIKRLQDPDKIKTADFTSTLQDTRRLESIVGSVLESATVATGITLVFFAKLILGGTALYKGYHLLFESSGVAFVVFLTLMQSSAVFGVIWSNYLFIDDLHTRRETQERHNDF
ncbi:hypothetical protein [Pseudomonas rhizophila]|uniref:hypothetical protein n=1 Tax=Pseudomonas rhizophila TaxID=2045200 RepID=UPI0030DAD486